MTELLKFFFYTLIYYELNNFLNNHVYNKYNIFVSDPVVFYPIIQTANIYILTISLIFTFHLLLFSKVKNYPLYSMSLIYIKYTLDNIMNNNMINIYQYEFRRTVMWCFTTPLILRLYADMNNLSLLNINAHYHIGTNVLHVLLYPFRKTYYNSYIITVLSFTEIYFIYKLFDFKQYKCTKFIIYIWLLFTLIYIFEMLNLFNIYDIQMCYLLSDMIAKITIMIIVNDFEEQTNYIKSNIDLQSISLLSTIKKNIKHFETSNNVTTKCNVLIKKINYELTSIIPLDKTSLKLELLKKILPLELEESYLSHTQNYKEFNFVCVLFTDIVSYTEIAKKYDNTIIYNLLNEIYTHFDEILYKYSNLQKIETIGDAYMVVGDIYNNDTKTNVKNIILLALDFCKEIKNIKTPDNEPLQLRIGINLGKVIVGILGNEIPRLCVVGNTVNVAARLQSTADPDSIQVSRHIYEIVKETEFGINIEFEKKEEVFLKNIGYVSTYNVYPNK